MTKYELRRQRPKFECRTAENSIKVGSPRPNAGEGLGVRVGLTLSGEFCQSIPRRFIQHRVSGTNEAESALSSSFVLRHSSFVSLRHRLKRFPKALLANITMQPLDLVNVSLTGRKLVESSAGTGKTYAITSLYVRLLLERRLSVGQILVVTFTEAATEDLKRRIRARIREAAAAFATGEAKDDFWRPFEEDSRLDGCASRSFRRFTDAGRGRHLHDSRFLPACAARQRVRKWLPI